MTTQISKPRRKRTVITIGVIAGLVLVAGGAATAFGVNSYNTETERLCATAISDQKTVVEGVVAQSQKGATAALDNAKDAAVRKAVPGATEYSKRTEVKADAAKKIEARPSASTLIANVQQRAEKLTKATKAPSCSTRDDAASITKNTKALKADATALSDAAGALTKDVTAFAADEQKRIAAEKAAAAKKAAAEKAAREKAAAEAAANAGAGSGGGESYAPQPENGGGGGGYYVPQPAPAPAPTPAPGPPAGGGGGGGGGGGWTPPPPPPGGGGCPAGMNCNV